MNLLFANSIRESFPYKNNQKNLCCWKNKDERESLMEAIGFINFCVAGMIAKWSICIESYLLLIVELLRNKQKKKQKYVDC